MVFIVDICNLGSVAISWSNRRFQDYKKICDISNLSIAPFPPKTLAPRSRKAWGFNFVYRTAVEEAITPAIPLSSSATSPTCGAWDCRRSSLFYRSPAHKIKSLSLPGAKCLCFRGKRDDAEIADIIDFFMVLKPLISPTKR